MASTTAVFGGSFDPPHVAHILCVEYVLAMGWVDSVLVIPVYAHAFDKALSPYPLRMEMCRAAFQHQARVFVDDIERTLPIPNYTLYTLRALKEREPERELRLLMGADVAAESSAWHRFEEVERLAPKLVVGRAGIKTESPLLRLLPEISSTHVRELFSKPDDLASQRELSELVPVRVLEIAQREGLYR